MKSLFIFLSLCTFFSSSLFAQSCYTIIESDTGIPSFYNPELDSKACELISKANALNANFEVLGCDFYPVLASVLPTEGYEKLFDDAVDALSTTHEAFAMVTKEYQVDGGINYRTFVKFPIVAPFDNLTPFERDIINNEFLNAIKGVGSTVLDNPAAEIAGINKLIELFDQIANGTLNLGDVNCMGSNCECLDVDDSQTYQRSGNTPSSNGAALTNGVAFDYTGLTVSGGGASGSIVSQMELSLPTKHAGLSFLNYVFIITDAENSVSELNAAESVFNTRDEKIKIWLNFGAIDANGKISNVCISYDDNLTFEDGEKIVDFYIFQSMQQWMPDLDWETFEDQPAFRPNTHPFTDYRNSPCLEVSAKWGKNCIVNTLAGPNDFKLGIAAGVLDGFLGLLASIYEGVQSLEETFDAALNTTKKYAAKIGHHSYMFASIAWKSGVYKAFSVYLGKTEAKTIEALDSFKESFDDFLTILTDLNSNRDQILRGIYEAVSEWMGGLIDGKTTRI